MSQFITDTSIPSQTSKPLQTAETTGPGSFLYGQHIVKTLTGSIVHENPLPGSYCFGVFVVGRSVGIALMLVTRRRVPRGHDDTPQSLTWQQNLGGHQ